MDTLHINTLIFAASLDIEGDLPVKVTEDTESGDPAAYLSKQEAIALIKHLTHLFKFSEYELIMGNIIDEC
jgi:hypothetical protein